ncbi:hypothetical protein QFC19_002678 [Naganishia cerealis]|uniref:Uncharacterized protein n=1 Tax=Naganishia cerealis TaxID=610337 RepID=A0ACC2W836_9TREE|nr:hypothetical protein QFC19_002678 [Naganishia cerealis]
MLTKIVLATLAATLTTLTTAAPVAESIEERAYTYVPSYNWGPPISGTSYGVTSGTACTKYEIISARGTTESQTSPYGNTATVK